jgi:hypothetical protein
MDGDEIMNFDLLGGLYVDGANMRAAGGINVMSNNDLIITSFGEDIHNGTNEIYTYTR